MTDEIRELLEKTACALEKNNIKAYIAEDKNGVIDIVKTLLKPGMTVSNGGSVTLSQCKVLDYLKSGGYNYLDRTKCESREKTEELYRRAFFCDAYFCSSNAVTEDGVLYNVDGNSNRVAAIAYGPESVIMVVGYNKIVKDLKEAEQRVKEIAAPKNCERLGIETFCKSEGRCVSMKNEDRQMCDGCGSDGRICCSYLISAHQRKPWRIKVILVGEELGY